MKNIFLCNTPSIIGQVYPNDVIEALKAEAFLDTTVLTEKALNNDIYADTEAIFASWDIPRLSVEQIAHHFPNLKYVFYAAGSVQIKIGPLQELGSKVDITESVVKELNQAKHPIEYVDARFEAYSVKLRQ